jgi:hypothetical protein
MVIFDILILHAVLLSLKSRVGLVSAAPSHTVPGTSDVMLRFLPFAMTIARSSEMFLFMCIVSPFAAAA